MNKEILRNKYREIRKNIPNEKRKIFNEEIFNQIIKLDEYNNTNLILVYVSRKYEVDTLKLINYSLNIGKKIAVPKCIDNEMKFCEIKSINDLTKGNFDILEAKSNRYLKDFRNSICIIPAIAFDINNNRIGYGKGYYDRFLKDYKETKIGICYNCCICEQIDVSQYDVKVDKIITNKKG